MARSWTAKRDGVMVPPGSHGMQGNSAILGAGGAAGRRWQIPRGSGPPAARVETQNLGSLRPSGTTKESRRGPFSAGPDRRRGSGPRHGLLVRAAWLQSGKLRRAAASGCGRPLAKTKPGRTATVFRPHLPRPTARAQAAEDSSFTHARPWAGRRHRIRRNNGALRRPSASRNVSGTLRAVTSRNLENGGIR